MSIFRSCSYRSRLVLTFCNAICLCSSVSSIPNSCSAPRNISFVTRNGAGDGDGDGDGVAGGVGEGVGGGVSVRNCDAATVATPSAGSSFTNWRRSALTADLWARDFFMYLQIERINGGRSLKSPLWQVLEQTIHERCLELGCV